MPGWQPQSGSIAMYTNPGTAHSESLREPGFIFLAGIGDNRGCVYYRALVHFEHLLSVLRALTLKNQNNSVH